MILRLLVFDSNYVPMLVFCSLYGHIVSVKCCKFFIARLYVGILFQRTFVQKENSMMGVFPKATRATKRDRAMLVHSLYGHLTDLRSAKKQLRCCAVHNAFTFSFLHSRAHGDTC